MIQVGIQEDVKVASAVKNDQGTLIVTFKKGGGLSVLEALSTGGYEEEEASVYFWPFKADDRLTDSVLIIQDITKRIESFKAQLEQILGQYMPIKGYKWPMLEGLGATGTGYSNDTEFFNALGDPQTSPVVCAKIYDNLVNAFIKEITPHLATNKQFRMKFVRTSKDKNFPTLPRFGAFIEPMAIPAGESKLKFTPWEQGYRTGDTPGQPSSWSMADPTPAAGETGSGNASAEAKVASNLFGAPTV